MNNVQTDFNDWRAIAEARTKDLEDAEVEAGKLFLFGLFMGIVLTVVVGIILR